MFMNYFYYKGYFFWLVDYFNTCFIIIIIIIIIILNCCSKGVFLVHVGLFTYLFLLFIVLKFSLCT
jgi:hypothetical protein